MCLSNGSPSHLLCYVQSKDTSDSTISTGSSSSTRTAVLFDGTIDLTEDDDADPMPEARGAQVDMATATKQMSELSLALSRQFEDIRPQRLLVNGWSKVHLVSEGSVCFLLCSTHWCINRVTLPLPQKVIGATVQHCLPETYPARADLRQARAAPHLE